MKRKNIWKLRVNSFTSKSHEKQWQNINYEQKGEPMSVCRFFYNWHYYGSS